ncbi:presqualene diphosphate synthase HpnD [Rhodospirillaceae bacterium SYSU D60014]|uniref:presqualene diphosphate synthase HpnD n=1 Tax=Virgifigura deserti TaxID=2268457 RepID=UPI000E66D29E
MAMLPAASLGTTRRVTLPEAKAEVRRLVGCSRSSFFLGMRILPAAKRDAIYAVYAFCRLVDDIADADMPAAAKLHALQCWKSEVEALFDGSPTHPVMLALIEPVRRFALPKSEFLAVLDGMAWDAAESICAPSMASLRRYCRLVAGAVGLLAIRVFEARGDGAADFAIALGEALQLTNILRDVHEDAQRGRLYVPAELLEAQGITAKRPTDVLRDPRLAATCNSLEALARQRLEEARRALARCDRTSLRPALVMMAVYSQLLDRLSARGWEALATPVRVPRSVRLFAAARAAALGPLWPRLI